MGMMKIEGGGYCDVCYEKNVFFLVFAFDSTIFYTPLKIYLDNVLLLRLLLYYPFFTHLYFYDCLWKPV